MLLVLTINFVYSSECNNSSKKGTARKFLGEIHVDIRQICLLYSPRTSPDYFHIELALRGGGEASNAISDLLSLLHVDPDRRLLLPMMNFGFLMNVSGEF